MALDIPSGIDADTGAILGIAFRADVTVTFSYEKVGLWLFPGQAYSGRVICRRVGIDDRSFLVQEKQGHAPGVAAFTKEDLARIPARRADSNKGSYGKVLVVAGSVDMAGAAIFSAKAAYLSGCGLVRILTPEENRIIIQSTLPEAVLTSYNSKKPDRETINGAMQWADVIVCGPGLGRGEVARLLVHTVLKNAAVPVILDADALNIISEETEILQRPHTELILTPHLGEMARLCGVTISYIKDHLLESAQEFARTYNLILAQKDARTITAIPYGMTYVNLSGNNGMATGGSGDVLTGVIAGLIAQGADPALAAPLGVYIHGLAGDAGAKSIGCYSLTAGTLLDALPGIFQEAAEKQAVPLISETKKEGNER
jgi:NAD(P)H-hydrate epimerase